MEIQIGQHIQRTWNKHPDTSDGFINIMHGSIFQVQDINERCVTVRVISCTMSSYVGGEMSIPRKYLVDETYYTIIPG